MVAFLGVTEYLSSRLDSKDLLEAHHSVGEAFQASLWSS